MIDVVVASFFLLMLAAVICWLVVVRKPINIILFFKYGNGGKSCWSYNAPSSLTKRFSYLELVAATDGFAEDRRLGEGGSGQVCKGIMTDLGCTVGCEENLCRI